MSKVVKSIKEAIKLGKLNEPFTITDFKKACPGFAEATYSSFLSKHCIRNPGGYSIYFIKVKPGLYKLSL